LLSGNKSTPFGQIIDNESFLIEDKYFELKNCFSRSDKKTNPSNTFKYRLGVKDSLKTSFTEESNQLFFNYKFFRKKFFKIFFHHLMR
jgi:hypothetical protein